MEPDIFVPTVFDKLFVCSSDQYVAGAIWFKESTPTDQNYILSTLSLPT
jgi:hypothetical protein